MESHKKLEPIVIELFTRGGKLKKHSFVFMFQFHFTVKRTSTNSIK